MQIRWPPWQFEGQRRQQNENYQIGVDHYRKVEHNIIQFTCDKYCLTVTADNRKGNDPSILIHQQATDQPSAVHFIRITTLLGVKYTSEHQA